MKPNKRLAAGVIALALLAGACGSDDDADTTATGADTTENGSNDTMASGESGGGDYEKAYADMRTAYHHMWETGGVLGGAIATQQGFADAPDNKAAATHTALSRLLGEHLLLATVATTKGLAGAPDFEAAAGALDANSVELAETVGSVYGDEAENAFLKQWRDHIRMFVDYTKATAAKDAAAQDKAVEELGGYVTNFGAFLAKAVGLPEAAVQESVKAHVFQLKDALDAAAAGSFDTAYAKVREGYHHMIETGGVLATAISTQQKLGDPNTKQAQTSIALGRLLGEHAAVAAVTTTKGLDGAPDFTQIAGALDANSVELAETVGSVYGDEAENAFLKQWRDHIRMFVDYTKATAAEDAAAQEQAVEELGGYVMNFGSFLAKAVGLPEAAVQESVKSHVFQLKDALDAYAAAKA